MADNTCAQCGAPLPQGAMECKYCGEAVKQTAPQPQYQQAPTYQAPPFQTPPYPQQPYGGYNQFNGVNPNLPLKSKVAAGVLALIFGGLGIHKFYLNNIGMGILYILFCWTFIPAFIGFIEGIVYLTMSDAVFQAKYHCRLH